MFRRSRLILIIILVIFLLGGFSGRFGGYQTDHRSCWTA